MNFSSKFARTTLVTILLAGTASLSLASVAQPTSPDDEPDQLSWEFFSMDRTLIRDYMDWAKTNPPHPAGIKPIPAAFRYTWIKAGDLQSDNEKWRPDMVGDMPIFRGPGGHNWGDVGNAFVDVPQDGVYRLWVRFRHVKGKNETFTLKVYPAAADDVSIPDIDSKLTVFEQVFARSHWSRSYDPIPGIASVETPEGGWFWEGAHSMAHMKKGRYRLNFSGGVYDNRPDLMISDIVFTEDPLHAPTDAEIPDHTVSGARSPCSELANNWALYCARPGASPWHAADPALRAHWLRWKRRLIEKLATSEYADYNWGHLASLVYFDDEVNLVGRPAEVKRQRKQDASYGATFKIPGLEFRNENASRESWKPSEFYSGSAPECIVGPSYPSDDRATYDLEIPANGRYAIWVQHFRNGGYQNGMAEVSVISEGVCVRRFTTGGQEGLRWTNGGTMPLKRGKTTIRMKVAGEGCNDRKAYSGSPVVSCVLLTQNMAFTPSREVEYPDGKPVGSASTGFWFSKDPWGGFTRYSEPGSFYYSPYAPVRWERLPPDAINPAGHAFTARNGEVSSQLFMLRNNTEAPITFKPELKVESISTSVRIVASTLTSGGFWSPMLLLKRNEITAPPHQNTAIWLTFDCRDVPEGVYAGAFAAAGNRVELMLTVKGSLKGAPVPYVYPYATPYPRRSCWEAFRDLGINMVGHCEITGADMKTYGILNQVGIRASAATEEDVRKGIAMAQRQGLKAGDYCWYLIDEPGAGSYEKWLAMARTIRSVDPEQLIWCNLGEWPPSKGKMQTMLEMMDYWDVACPYFTQFGVSAKDRDYNAYVEKLRNVGKIRLLYETPCMGDYEKQFWAPTAILKVAERALENNRNGWAFFSMKYGTPYDDVYTGNTDHAVSIYPGAYGATLQTRNSEAVRESIQRWKGAKLAESARD